MGHRYLGAGLRDVTVPRVAARHAKRIVSDAYGRGVTRGGAGVCSLLAQPCCNAVVVAEVVKTSCAARLSARLVWLGRRTWQLLKK